MGIPAVGITILDNQLGQSNQGLGNTEVVIGCAAGGTVANFVPYVTNDPNVMLTNSGYGPATRLAAFIATQSGNAVEICTVPTVTPGSNTAIFVKAGNTGTSVITLSGTPNDDYYLIITPVQGTTIGTTGGVVNISVDGGLTYAFTVNLGTANTITTGSAFTTYTGLTINFGAGTLVASDVFYAVSTAPAWNDAGVQSAISACAAVKFQTFQDIMVAGVSGATDVTNFQTYMNSLATTSKRWSRLLCAVRDATWGGASTETEAAWMTSIETAFSTTDAKRVGVVAGHYPFTDPYTGSLMRSNGLYGAAAIDSAVVGSIDLGEVDLGSVPGLFLPTSPVKFGNGTFFFHDEDSVQGLDAARFLSFRQFVGFPGIYVTNPNLMAAPGSDFNWLQHGHVIDEAAGIIYAFFTRNLNRAVRVDPKTGFILPQERLRLQNGCQAALNNQLAQQTSGIIVQVSSSDNILSTATLTVYEYIVPLAYLKQINNTLALLNPANATLTQTFSVAGV